MIGVKDNEYDNTYQQLSNIRIESIESTYSNTTTNFQPFTSEEMHSAIGHLKPVMKLGTCKMRNETRNETCETERNEMKRNEV
jgi:hypothetical protein